jgi:lactoylglutathione lyase
MAEWFARPGVVLFTENYEACCAFYRDVLQLPIEQVTPHLVRFGWGAAYLMVERGGVANLAGKPASEGPVLRFNVDDMEATAALLRSRGVAVMVNVHDWGTTGDFLDPDGNRCELRDGVGM